MFPHALPSSKAFEKVFDLRVAEHGAVKADVLLAHIAAAALADAAFHLGFEVVMICSDVKPIFCSSMIAKWIMIGRAADDDGRIVGRRPDFLQKLRDQSDVACPAGIALVDGQVQLRARCLAPGFVFVR